MEPKPIYTTYPEPLSRDVTLAEIVMSYYAHHGLVMPNADQALLFLVSEIGELADAHVHGQDRWVRNDGEKERSITDEVGDVMMMLTVCAMQHGLDPVGAMLAKMRKRGFPATLPTTDANPVSD
jgi:NTP pyrophosphatase (non-canonical NTP hydrolase)